MTIPILPTFSDIETYSEVVEENELFEQFTNQFIPNHYDSNFIALHFSPSYSEFLLLEKMHLEYQLSINQSHVKLVWPENSGLSVDLLDYLDTENYKIGMMNLYWVTFKEFTSQDLNTHIEIKTVTQKTLPHFLAMNYEEDRTHGVKFADHKQLVYNYQFHLPHVQFILGYYKQQPVGSMITVSSDSFLEVDNLMTASNNRNQGIASTLLKHVIEKAKEHDQAVILLADAEDTVKTMYEKMGFQFAGYQISAQKKLRVQ